MQLNDLLLGAQNSRPTRAEACRVGVDHMIHLLSSYLAVPQGSKGSRLEVVTFLDSL